MHDGMDGREKRRRIAKRVRNGVRLVRIEAKNECGKFNTSNELDVTQI
jgi:hypothetical protein